MRHVTAVLGTGSVQKVNLNASVQRGSLETAVKVSFVRTFALIVIAIAIVHTAFVINLFN